MRMHARTIALYALFGCLVGSVVPPSLAQNDRLYWLNNYEEALREAKKTQQPIFLEFRCEP